MQERKSKTGEQPMGLEKLSVLTALRIGTFRVNQNKQQQQQQKHESPLANTPGQALAVCSKPARSQRQAEAGGGGDCTAHQAQGSRVLQVGQQLSRVHSDVRKCTEDSVMAADFLFVVVVISRSAHDHHLHTQH